MDPRLLRYYNRELQFMREMGQEFAREYPKIAARLGMEELSVSDPYVERLLEGFAFLAARVQLKLDAEFPTFTQHLLEMVFPHYLAPLPSMAIARFMPLLSESGLASGYELPRGTALQAARARGQQTACEFRTGHALTLWPLELSEARYFGSAGALGTVKVDRLAGVRAGVRISLRATAGLAFDELSMDTLTLYLHGQDEVPGRLYEQILGNAVSVLVRPKGGRDALPVYLPADCLQPVGFAEDEALLPPSPRTFSGYRFLQEYFGFPARFRFVSITGLQQALRRFGTTELELFVLFDRKDSLLDGLVSADHFALNCVPVINLFPKRADRVHLREANHEHHVVADRTRPMDFEVWSVTGLQGFGTSAAPEQRFEPLYSHHDGKLDTDRAYYTCRRAPRVVSSSQQRDGTRSSYIGSETYLSLVDVLESPLRSSLRQVEAMTLCTNRDLPLHFQPGQGTTDFTLDTGAPVERVQCLGGPTRPRAAFAAGSTPWRVINHLSLNYLSLTDADDGEGAQALRTMLGLYADENDQANQRQIDGVRSIRSEPITARIPVSGPASFGRGLGITLDCDETAFEGSGLFLFGQVMEAFFARYVSVNSFTETTLRSSERGEIMRWPARLGQRLAL
ncbi:MAG: type VI secretion system baseplate subunit TssF [Pseudomonadota bacterium]